VLDKSGAEAVGGVVTARYGSNPMQVIDNVKAKIAELEPGLPSKTLADGTVSQVKIVPFYDRTELINETIGTLEEALKLEVLITIVVIILMLLNLRSSLLVSASLPVAVLMCFIAMRYFGVDANIVALSGIVIAIGTMVDMGIVLVESMVNRIEEAPPGESLVVTIYKATTEVASAVLTAVATTVVSFLPVFTMQAAEGKLFRPLAYTKTFALIAAIIVAITILPAVAHSVFSMRSRSRATAYVTNGLAVLGGLLLLFFVHPFYGGALILIGLAGWINYRVKTQGTTRSATWASWATNILYALLVTWLLASVWMPLGVVESTFTNFLFVALLAGLLIGFFHIVIYYYEPILRFLLRFKILFLLLVGGLLFLGFRVYQNTGEEFMPTLDEGAFLLMPTSMPHSGMQENIKNLRLLDMAVTAIPEVKSVVGKAGRANTALDPAPMSMYENVILYKSEYKTNEAGQRIRFRYEDGQVVDRWVEGESVVQAPTNRVMGYGTKVVVRQLQTSSGAVSYWRVVRMLATSYSASTAGTPKSSPYYGRTATGLKMRHGIVAVDPNVISLGSKVYVPGYGVGLAADTGGAINGKRIDLGYDDDNLQLWYRWVDVYLLTPVPDHVNYTGP
jgi:Cu(I)/Ag(I) efflux system membrane protein CusA/SilA